MRIGHDKKIERLEAFTASGIRGTVLPPWPKTTIALTLSRWST
jgi:hypothetical protein